MEMPGDLGTSEGEPGVDALTRRECREMIGGGLNRLCNFDERLIGNVPYEDERGTEPEASGVFSETAGPCTGSEEVGADMFSMAPMFMRRWRRQAIVAGPLVGPEGARSSSPLSGSRKRVAMERAFRRDMLSQKEGSGWKQS